MIPWWVDHVLPSVVAGILLGVVGYLKLHFEKSWPYWGRRHEEDKDK